jgi:ribosomal protein S27E
MNAQTTIAAASPRIYAACLASYNAGRLFGVWIDCEGKSGEEIGIEISDMLARSPEPNVMRRKCPDCGHYQTDARPYRENSDECDNCGEPLSGEFSPSAEEWAIHDHEGFAGLIKSEWPDLDEVAELAEALADDDDDKRRGLLWLVNDRGFSISDALAHCDEVRAYTADVFDLAADYAQELAADIVPDFDEKASQWPFSCIDWEQAGKELTMGGDVDLFEQDGERFLVTNASDF